MIRASKPLKSNKNDCGIHINNFLIESDQNSIDCSSSSSYSILETASNMDLSESYVEEPLDLLYVSVLYNVFYIADLKRESELLSFTKIYRKK